MLQEDHTDADAYFLKEREKMRSSIKVILYTSLLTIVFFVLTYLVTVNMETNYISLNVSWLSNNLFLTLFGGAFASMLVVLLCEWQKYLNAKNESESVLFFQAYYLYQVIYQVYNNISDYQNNPKICLTENLLDDLSQKVYYQKNALQNVDYIPIYTYVFRKTNKVIQLIMPLRSTILPLAEELSHAPNMLRIAIYEALLELPELNHDKTRITSSINPVSSVLEIYKTKCKLLLEQLKKYLLDFDQIKGNRFQAEKMLKSIEDHFISIIEVDAFEDFIKQETNANK